MHIPFAVPSTEFSQSEYLLKGPWAQGWCVTAFVTPSVLMTLTKLLRSSRIMNHIEIDTVNTQVPKSEALSGLKEIPCSGIHFLLNWNCFRSRLFWTQLRTYLFQCIFRIFLKGTILAPQKGTCDSAIDVKGPEGCLLGKRFHSPNSPSDFLHQGGF